MLYFLTKIDWFLILTVCGSGSIQDLGQWPTEKPTDLVASFLITERAANQRQYRLNRFIQAKLWQKWTSLLDTCKGSDYCCEQGSYFCHLNCSIKCSHALFKNQFLSKSNSHKTLHSVGRHNILCILFLSLYCAICKIHGVAYMWT